MIRRHREMDADITLCSCSVSRERADQRGLVRVDPHTGVYSQLTSLSAMLHLCCLLYEHASVKQQRSATSAHPAQASASMSLSFAKKPRVQLEEVAHVWRSAVRMPPCRVQLIQS